RFELLCVVDPVRAKGVRHRSALFHEAPYIPASFYKLRGGKDELQCVGEEQNRIEVPAVINLCLAAMDIVIAAINRCLEHEYELRESLSDGVEDVARTVSSLMLQGCFPHPSKGVEDTIALIAYWKGFKDLLAAPLGLLQFFGKLNILRHS